MMLKRKGKATDLEPYWAGYASWRRLGRILRLRELQDAGLSKLAAMQTFRRGEAAAARQA